MTTITRRFLVTLQSNDINLLRHEEDPHAVVRVESSEIDSMDPLVSVGDIVDLTWDDESNPIRYDSMQKVS